MNVDIAIGQNRTFELREALLVYQSGEGAFVTRHEVINENKERPRLGPPRALSREFLKTLVSKLGNETSVAVLPENILAQGFSVRAWWTPAQRRQMFIEDAQGRMKSISGCVFPHPALVFVVANDSLFVRALRDNRRPGPRTSLQVAPYWNVDQQGRVCLGSARSPAGGIESIQEWERVFFESAFTHPSSGVKLTNHRGGFAGLWRGLSGKNGPFPSKYLVDAKQTLGEFVQGVWAQS